MPSSGPGEGVTGKHQRELALLGWAVGTLVWLVDGGRTTNGD